MALRRADAPPWGDGARRPAERGIEHGLGELVRRLGPDLLTAAGLGEVREEELLVEVPYRDFDELWSTLLLGIGPAGGYLVARPGEQQDRLRTAYRDRLRAPDGEFTLAAVARAAVGRR